MRRTGPILWLAIVGLLAGSCSDPEVVAAVKALGEGCLIDSDCEGELVCVFRRCHVECETTRDCRERDLDSQCVIGDRPSNVCLLPDEASCEASGEVGFPHADCPASTRCGPDHRCRDACTDDGDCFLPEQRCFRGVCADEEAEELPVDSPLLTDDPLGPGATCLYNSECLAPLACLDGLCDVACQDDRDCPSERSCVPIDAPGLGVTFGCRRLGADPSDPAHCSNLALDGDETDLDCGGGCDPCESGLMCEAAADCRSKVCRDGRCRVPTCSDGVTNGFESDTDCGGAYCAPCGEGVACQVAADCAVPYLCVSGTCTAPSCMDGTQDGDETGVDCGGGCPGCAMGAPCQVATDCADGVCAAGFCAAPDCEDGEHNGTESDTDCGGGCSPCGDGALCGDGTDCESSVCTAGTCTAPTCSDTAMNGLETDVNCGGPDCSPCIDGLGCAVDGDCASGVCSGGACAEVFTVDVALLGTGTGVVYSSPAGRINCSATASLCQATLTASGTIELFAAPAVGDTFTGFGGDCSGASCVIANPAADVTVTATFDSP